LGGKTVTKKIRCDYFRPCLEQNVNQVCSLTLYLQEFCQMPFERRIMQYAGNTIRLSSVIYHANYQPENGSPFSFPLWQLTYTRIRPDVPGTTTMARAEITPLDLEDDEYIAEDTTALYDPELSYLVIQRNKTGTPPSAMQQFFNKMNQAGEEHNIEFQIMVRDNTYERVRRHNYHKSINIRFRNVRSDAIKQIVGDNPSLKHILQTAATFTTDQEYPVSAELILTIPGRHPDSSFRHQAYNSIINLANKLISSDLVDKLKVQGKIDEENPFEPVDLVNDVVRDELYFNVANKELIPSITIFDRIAVAYAEKRPSLVSK
jgi:hypothetical protein